MFCDTPQFYVVLKFCGDLFSFDNMVKLQYHSIVFKLLLLNETSSFSASLITFMEKSINCKMLISCFRSFCLSSSYVIIFLDLLKRYRAIDLTHRIQTLDLCLAFESLTLSTTEPESDFVNV